MRYREVLADSMLRAAAAQGIELPVEEAAAFAASLPSWRPFEDSSEALACLAQRYKLVILSNVDTRDLEASVAQLGAPFAELVTAEQIESYKPARRHWDIALERLGLERAQVLHVAQSLYHDIGPAKELGFDVVWIDRQRQGLPSDGSYRPDLVLPDLASLARQLVPTG